MSTTPPPASISLQQHRNLWALVKHYIKLRNHLMRLALGVDQFEGVFHRARVQEACTDIALYMSRYHWGTQLPSLPLESGPWFAEELLDCIADHTSPQEQDLLEQMLDLVYWMHDERKFREPTRHSDATTIVTWLLCQKLDDLATYCDRRTLENVRATHTMQIRVSSETEAGRLLSARLGKERGEGALTLWNTPVGTWCYTGVSMGALLVRIAFVPAFLERVQHWTELRPRIHPAPCKEAREEC